MNAFDAVIVVLMVVGMVGGYRLGFVPRVLSWVGLGIGLFIVIRILPWVLDRIHGAAPTVVLIVTMGLIFVGAMAGQAAGFAIGTRIRPRGLGKVGRLVDRSAGALAGAFGVVVLLWLTLPLMADTPGWPAEQARGSALAGGIDERLPDAPDSMQALRSFMGEENIPAVFDAIRPTPDLGPPPAASGLDPATTDRVRRSVVLVEGVACDRIQNGSGFVVAPDLVVTNAHVVAGEGITEIERDDGSRANAIVVRFDPRRDLAVLHVPGLAREPLDVVPSRSGASGGVFGHPSGGPLRVSPFSVSRTLTAVGRDIYGTDVTTREVLELRAGLRPGDSGSALVDQSGDVVGVAFARAPDNDDVAYALSTSELEPLLTGDLTDPVGAGPCSGAG